MKLFLLKVLTIVTFALFWGWIGNFVGVTTEVAVVGASIYTLLTYQNIKIS